MQFKTLLVPPAVLGAAALFAACSPVTALNAVVPSKARMQAGVSYGPDERHKLDIYIPVAVRVRCSTGCAKRARWAPTRAECS